MECTVSLNNHHIRFKQGNYLNVPEPVVAYSVAIPILPQVSACNLQTEGCALHDNSVISIIVIPLVSEYNNRGELWRPRWEERHREWRERGQGMMFWPWFCVCDPWKHWTWEWEMKADLMPTFDLQPLGPFNRYSINLLWRHKCHIIVINACLFHHSVGIFGTYKLIQIHISFCYLLIPWKQI